MASLPWRLSATPWLAGCPVPGEQAVDIVRLGVSDDEAFEDFGDPGEWLDATQLGGPDQRRHHRPVLRAGVVAGKQGILAARRDAALAIRLYSVTQRSPSPAVSPSHQHTPYPRSDRSSEPVLAAFLF